MKKKTSQNFLKNIKQNFFKCFANIKSLISNKLNKEKVIVYLLDKDNALNTTQHELSSAANEKRLDDAIKRFETINKKSSKS